MIIDDIKALLARALADQRLSALTGPELKALYISLPDNAWTTMASYFVNNDSRELGNYQINGAKSLLYNQAMAEVNAITADGNITAAEITALLGSG